MSKRTIIASEQDAQAEALLRRIGWRTLPLLLLLYFIAYLDRINIGFAATAMQRDLHFSDSIYGTGAGLFFVGTLLAQIPSNLLLYRIGARRMIAGLMIVWGCISGSMAFVHTPWAFLVLRFLLGAAEAGFFPGIILYLTLWLPRRRRTSFTACFVFAIPLANIFGGPLSSWILQRGSTAHFADWQMLLLLEAIPAVLVGCLLPGLMTDSPLEASWLSDSDRALLAQARAQDEPIVEEIEAAGAKGFTIGSPLHVLRFAAIYFAMQFGLYSQNFWLPKILHGMGMQTRWIGWQVAAVYSLAAAGMLIWGRVADRAPTRRSTLSIPLLIAAAAYASTLFAAHAGSGTLAIFLVIATFGAGAAGGLSATATFWAQATLGQKTAAVAGMIAAVNSLGNLGGFVGPALLGRLHEQTGGYGAGMLTVSAGLVAAALLLNARRTVHAHKGVPAVT